MRGASILVGAALLAAACGTFDPKHPLIGRPEIDAAQPGYWIWISDGMWHLRITPAGRAHRFQGSLAGVAGGVAELKPTRPELKDQIALVGDSVQFDVENPAADGSAGFDARVAGGCARFELLVDRRKTAEVRLGPRAMQTHHGSFERCP
ncbi:MAG TPA: hypothetical protein VFF06_32090 [Polyangia bacterium]|nr:hypothetical protein [Polyangia bacterium]